MTPLRRVALRTPDHDVHQVSSAVSSVAEALFGTVAALHAAALQCHRDERATTGNPGAQPFSSLQATVGALLLAPGQIAIGLGMIVAPSLRAGIRSGLCWWQVDAARTSLVALDPDLRPSSMGFYDYAVAEWFDVPRRTGSRHVVGPYVDVHGTGSYVLTMTVPVVVDGEFLGVVGADVPVSGFESRVLHLLSARTARSVRFVIVNDERRVVLSTSPEALTGCLSTTGPDEPDVGERLPDLPWWLRVTAHPKHLALPTTEPSLRHTQPRVERTTP